MAGCRRHLTLVSNSTQVSRYRRSTLTPRSMSRCLPLHLHTRSTPIPIHPNCHHCPEYRHSQDASSRIACPTAQSTMGSSQNLQSSCLSGLCTLIRSSVMPLMDHIAQFITGNPFTQTASLSRLGLGIASGSLNTAQKINPVPNRPMSWPCTAPISLPDLFWFLFGSSASWTCLFCWISNWTPSRIWSPAAQFQLRTSFLSSAESTHFQPQETPFLVQWS